jgi:predicted nucleotide-binding protein
MSRFAPRHRLDTIGRTSHGLTILSGMQASEFWHVIVSRTPVPGAKARRGGDAVAVDKTRESIEDRILEPRRQGQAIAVSGRAMEWSEIERIRITVSDEPSDALVSQIKAEDRASSVAVFGGPGYQWRAAAPSRVDPRRVMVVYGRDGEARRAMFDFLRALGLHPGEWRKLITDTEKAAPYIGEVLERAFENAAAVVVLLTPDDEAKLRDVYIRDSDPEFERNPTPQARPNVLFEAGMAFGLHPDRTVLVELGPLRPFSDVFGRHVVRLDGSEQPLRDIAGRLKTAGCAVDDSGDDWAHPDRFPRR